jgi:hypothetical protein
VRPIWITGALVLFAVLPLARPTPQSASRPAQIIVIRHADEPADPHDPHLSPAGVRRVERLVSFIVNDPTMARFGPPVAVFATRTTRHGNGQRTQETVAPLAQALELPVQTPFLAKDYVLLARRILDNPAYVGKTVLVCWNHTEIPLLARALGVKPQPPKWDERVYDQVYVISYDDGQATLAVSRYDAE